MFCTSHLRAPAGQRGGWLSAEMRRRRMAGSKDTVLDASNVTKRLWIGGKPPFDRDLPDFDVLVLCAQELQPTQLAFSRRLIRCPLPDGVLTTNELRRALVVGRSVAQELADGHRALVTCHMGWNRSGLVAGLAMGLCHRMSADQIVTRIRMLRSPNALGNQHFVQILKRFIGDGVPRR